MATTATNGKDRRRAASHMHKTLQSLREDVNTLGNDVAHFAEAISYEAKDRVNGLAGRAQEAAGATVEALQNQVRERPGVSIGLAAGAGLILGVLLASRR